jgi:glycosyltransferase involved in cell wall biosynthesis
MKTTTIGKVTSKLNINDKRIISNVIVSSVIRRTIPKFQLTHTNGDYIRELLSKYSKKPSANSVLQEPQKQNIVNDLSIIVPAYNVENYIQDCIDSILNQQTNYKYQIIIVNDGSTDQTKNILETYDSYTQITVIHQENKGFSGSRNTALDNINGRYVMFVDSDDKLYDVNSIQKLLDVAYKNNLDIVEGGYSAFSENKVIQEYRHSNVHSNKALGLLRGYPWGKVIKSKLFSNIRYPEGYWFEDTIFAYLIFPQIHEVATIDVQVYLYRRNQSSISHTARKKNKSIDTYWILELMLEDIKKLKVKPSQDIYEHTLGQVITNFKRTAELTEVIKQSIFILTCQILNTEFKEYQTEDKKFKKLEKAIREENYKEYYFSCCFI